MGFGRIEQLLVLLTDLVHAEECDLERYCIHLAACGLTACLDLIHDGATALDRVAETAKDEARENGRLDLLV